MEPRHTYGVSPRRRAIMYGCWAIVALPLLIGGLAAGESGLFVAAVIVSGVMLPVFLLVDRSAKLIITPRGIEARQAGATLTTSWSNVSSLSLVRGREGFILREPMSGRGPQRLAATANVRFSGSPLYDDARLRLINNMQFIPIEAFAYWLDHGDLRQVIARLAPDLESIGGATAADLTGTKSHARFPGKIVLVSIVIAVAAAAGILIALLPEGSQTRGFRILIFTVPFLFAYTATRNLIAAWKLLAARRYFGGLLWAGMALAQILIALAVIGSVIGP